MQKKKTTKTFPSPSSVLSFFFALVPTFSTNSRGNACYAGYYYFGFKNASSKVHFRSTEGQTFYWSIMTVDDSIKCRFANSGVTDQVGGFQNPGVCLQAFPSFLPHPLPALLLAPLFSRSLTLVPRSFLLNRTETLATQAIKECIIFVVFPRKMFNRSSKTFNVF